MLHLQTRVAFATYTVQCGAVVAVGYLALRREPTGDVKGGLRFFARSRVAILCRPIGLFVLIWATTINPLVAAELSLRFSWEAFLASVREGIWTSDFSMFYSRVTSSADVLAFALLARPLRSLRCYGGVALRERHGRSYRFLDCWTIGWWDGYWSFYVERRGAARVFATDDSSQNRTGQAGFKLARELLKSSVESDLSLSVYELHRLKRRFDVILYLGVFHHLFDQFYAFTQIRYKCHNESILVIEGDVHFGLIRTSEQSAALFSRDVRTAPRFVPDPDTLRFLVNAAYFDIAEEAVLPVSKRADDSSPIQGVNRMLMVCQPFWRANSCHEYRAPSGLHEYDARRDLPPHGWSDLYAGDPE
jgi:tRNA (mo5U34)-methyltransferase